MIECTRAQNPSCPNTGQPCTDGTERQEPRHCHVDVRPPVPRRDGDLPRGKLGLAWGVQRRREVLPGDGPREGEGEGDEDVQREEGDDGPERQGQCGGVEDGHGVECTPLLHSTVEFEWNGKPAPGGGQNSCLLKIGGL